MSNYFYSFAKKFMNRLHTFCCQFYFHEISFKSLPGYNDDVLADVKRENAQAKGVVHAGGALQSRERDGDGLLGLLGKPFKSKEHLFEPSLWRKEHAIGARFAPYTRTS